ncbi:MAG TPA: hypothetical protein VK395_12830 [Gemmataceae bacterium]|nr:hypothetical protein [Gemmataceae bacterium]
MRLTLRTLLAYLDDTLEPAQTKLIGQKVAESDAAQELIARIKQVARRRRLTTPAAAGSGAKLDANIIAEYLDNVLASENLAEVEETCLSSDVHLAEVAACHQILTLVLGEPALVPPTARQRMYGLIRGKESIPDRKPAPAAIGQGAINAADLHNDEADEALLLGLPLYRQGSLSRWLVPAAAAVLLLGAGFAIWMAITWAREKELAKPSSNFANATPDERSNPLEPLTTPKPETESQPRKESTPQQHPTPVAAGINNSKRADSSEPAKHDEKPAEQAVDLKPSPPPRAQPPSKDRRELGKTVLVAPCVLLQQSAETGSWQRLSPEKRISSLDQLVSLPGYRSDLRLDTGVQLQLWGNLPQFSRTSTPVLESVVTLYSNPSFDLDFKLDHGRVLLTNRKEEGPARVRVRFHDEVWDLTLEDKNTEVVIELFGICLPYSAEPGGGEPEVLTFLYALKGQVQLRVRYETHLLRSISAFQWDSLAGAAAHPESLERPPDWYAKGPAQGPAMLSMQSAVKEMSQRLIAKDRIDIVVAEAMKDPINVGSRVLAVRCLGAMTEFGKLLDALGDEKHVDVRMVALEELRHLLGLSAANDTLLHNSLRQKNYSEAQAQTVMQLLHGFSPAQWADPTTRATTVEYLNHEKATIRQLTHALLCALVPEGQKIPYDPVGDSEQRDRGAKEWQKVVIGGKPAAKLDKSK